MFTQHLWCFGVGRIDWCLFSEPGSAIKVLNSAVEVLNVIASSLKTRFGAPEPLVIWAQLHAAGSNLAVCLRTFYRTRTARNRRVKDARRSVTGPLSDAFARDMRVGEILAVGR